MSTIDINSADSIVIESSKPSIIFGQYFSKIQREIEESKKSEYINDFLGLYEIKLNGENFAKLSSDTRGIYELDGTDTYKLKDDIRTKTPLQQVSLLSGVDNKCSITRIKEFLNKIFSDDLLENNKEKRVFNSFIKEELIKTGSTAPVFPNLNDIVKPTDIFMIGGDYTEDIKNIGDLLQIMIDKKAECEDYEKNMTFITNKYNYECMKLMHHNIFMIGVFNNIFLLDNYMVYTHLDIGLVQFYKNIVENIIEKIKKGAIDKRILYFKKYHMVNLQILDRILKEITTKLDTEQTIQDYVNIKLSGENLRYGCLILNFIKNQLLDYILNAESNITIYARINDWGTMPKLPLFTKEKKLLDGKKYLVLNPDACELELGSGKLSTYKEQLGSPRNTGTKYKFNEVFESYIKNDTLATCMGLTLNISKSINTGLITYGYSGTGKTYTLFGSSNPDNKASGLLQSALQIDGVTKISFRIYELYGMGFQYPFYWDGSGTINHFIYHYDVELDGNSFKIKDVFKIGSNNFDKYTKITPQSKDNIDVITGMEANGLVPTTKNESLGFVTIEAEQLAKVMGNFEKLVSDIDMRRKEGRRIRETPNNPESSRSIIVYDFVLDIPTNKKPSTNFLLIDLPGKEDIEKTFITKYYNLFESKYNTISTGLPYGITDTNYPKYIKMLLLSTSLQPLLIPIIDPEGFMLGVNKYIKINKMLINELIRQTNNLEFNNQHKPVNQYVEGRIENDKFSISKKRNIITWDAESNEKLTIANYGIFFMTSIVQNNCFDVLSEIVKTIVDLRINKYIRDRNLVSGGNSTRDQLLEEFQIVKPNIYNKLTSVAKKSDIDIDIDIDIEIDIDNSKLLAELKKLYEAMNPTEYSLLVKIVSAMPEIEQINSILLNIVQYDYYLTPYEGLYINENIVGIIKYCESNKKTKQFSVQQQNTDLTLANQSSIVRAMLLNNSPNTNTRVSSKNGTFQNNLDKRLGLSFSDHVYTKCIKSLSSAQLCEQKYTYNIYPLITIVGPEYKLSVDKFDIMYDTILKFYQPNCVYRFDIPLIQSILGYYLDAMPPAIPRITDFKMFYLVSNNSLELKCTAQENLLYLTKDFIENITKDV